MTAKTLRVISDLLVKINVGLLGKIREGVHAPPLFSYGLLFFSQFINIIHNPFLFKLIPTPIAANLSQKVV